MADTRTPAHVLRASGDRRALCGERDPLPKVLEQFVQAHIDGWGMVVCAGCAEHLPALRPAPIVPIPGQLDLFAEAV